MHAVNGWRIQISIASNNVLAADASSPYHLAIDVASIEDIDDLLSLSLSLSLNLAQPGSTWLNLAQPGLTWLRPTPSSLLSNGMEPKGPLKLLYSLIWTSLASLLSGGSVPPLLLPPLLMALSSPPLLPSLFCLFFPFYLL